jgi:hypothetical protein
MAYYSVMISMRTHMSLLLAILVVKNMLPDRAQAQASTQSNPVPSPRGNELDLVAEYLLNKGLNFSFGYARLFAGQLLKTAAQGHDYSYPYAYVEYNFSKSGFHFPVTPNKLD